MITPEQIKTERLQLGLSQEKLAYISGISCRTVFNIENGRTSPSNYSLTAIENTLNELRNLTNQEDPDVK